MHAYQIDPAENADLQRLADIEQERAAMCGGIIVPTRDPDHGKIVGSVLGRLSAAPVARPLSGSERRFRELALFGAEHVRIVETAFPNFYRSR